MFDYKRIDELNAYLNRNLQELSKETCPEDMANKITQVYEKGIQQFSYSKCSSRKHTPKLPWISPAIIPSITHKNKLFKEKLKNPMVDIIAQYNQYRNILTKVIRNAKRTYYLSELHKHAGNPKETWNTIQTLIKSKQEANDTPSSLVDNSGRLRMWTLQSYSIISSQR